MESASFRVFNTHARNRQWDPRAENWVPAPRFGGAFLPGSVHLRKPPRMSSERDACLSAPRCHVLPYRSVYVFTVRLPSMPVV